MAPAVDSEWNEELRMTSQQFPDFTSRLLSPISLGRLSPGIEYGEARRVNAVFVHASEKTTHTADARGSVRQGSKVVELDV